MLTGISIGDDVGVDGRGADLEAVGEAVGEDLLDALEARVAGAVDVHRYVSTPRKFGSRKNVADCGYTGRLSIIEAVPAVGITWVREKPALASKALNSVSVLSWPVSRTSMFKS